MGFLSNLFGKKEPDIEKLIQDLSFQSPEIRELQAKIYRMEQDPVLLATGAAAAFAGLGRDPNATGPLAELARLKNRLSEAQKKEARIRARAASNLGKLRNPKAVQPLIAALGENSYEYVSLRLDIAKALGSIGDKEAIEPLNKLLQYDFNDSVRQAAQQALELIQKANS